MQASSFKTPFRTGVILPLKDIAVENASLPTGGCAVAIFELPEEKKPLLNCKLSLNAGFVQIDEVPMLVLEIHSNPRYLYCLLDASDEATWKMLKGWRRSGAAYFCFASKASSELVAIRIDSAFAAEQEEQCRSVFSPQNRGPDSGANAAFVEAAVEVAASGAVAEARPHHHGEVAGERQLDVAAAFPGHFYGASCLRARQVLRRDWNMAEAMWARRVNPSLAFNLRLWKDAQLIEE